MLILFAVAFAGEIKVVRVTDGDTIKTRSDGKEIIVRLVGIDAPETSKKKNEPGQPYSRKATQLLASLLLNKTITIKEYGSDQYGRILGLVFSNGKNVNLEMVKAGLAEVYRGSQPRYFNVKIYQDAEAEATKQSSICGLWVINTFRRGNGGGDDGISEIRLISVILTNFRYSQYIGSWLIFGFLTGYHNFLEAI